MRRGGEKRNFFCPTPFLRSLFFALAHSFIPLCAFGNECLLYRLSLSPKNNQLILPQGVTVLELQLYYTNAGLDKSAIPLSQASKFLLWASNFSFSLDHWARHQACCLPDKSSKEQPKTCPGQAKFESHLSQGQAEIQVFLSPANKHKVMHCGWLSHQLKCSVNHMKM